MQLARQCVHAARAPRAGLGTIETAVLCGVVLVVVLVSVPWIDALARTDNETDAVDLVRVLGESAELEPELTLGALVAGDARLARRFADVEPLDGGRRLRCHGYLFELVPAAGGGRDLLAWPWEHGRTGGMAFVWTADGALLGHANTGGEWQGPEHPPSGAWAAGWERLAR